MTPHAGSQPRRRRRTKLLLVPFAVGAAVAAGYAFAAWTSTGAGTGEAKSTTSVNSEIVPGTNAPDLYPGASGTITVTITNPNPYPVVVNSISAGTSALVNGTCTAGTVTSDARPSDATGLVQADGSTKVIPADGDAEYALDTHMSTSAVDACKSQTFSLALTAALSSAAS